MQTLPRSSFLPHFISLSIATATIMTALMTGACTSSKNDATQPSTAAVAAESIGIGPVTEKMTMDSKIDTALATRGKAMFENRCTACHKIEAKYIGPALAGVTLRRRPEWIMNIILNPTEMTQKDETAKELLATYIAQMANQNLTKDEARSVLEYFRQNDSTK